MTRGEISAKLGSVRDFRTAPFNTSKIPLTLAMAVERIGTELAELQTEVFDLTQTLFSRKRNHI